MTRNGRNGDPREGPTRACRSSRCCFFGCVSNGLFDGDRRLVTATERDPQKRRRHNGGRQHHQHRR